MNMKFREVPESNYRSFWLPSGKTIRIQIDPSKPITELEYPEFYDIKLTNQCAGACKYCYQNSTTSEAHFDDVVGKLRRFFTSIPKQHLPYQIAYGGGEPTSHPDFNEVMRMTKEEFDICPNYTTNGQWIDEHLDHKEKLLQTTKNYCGGVAVSCHPHLEMQWGEAAHAYNQFGVRLNFHNIISDKASIDKFIEIFNEWKSKVEYFVLLPHMAVGRAEHIDLDWDYFVKVFPKENTDQIAFGANFYPYLQRKDLDIKVSLYEPEIMSKYVSLEGNGVMYPSSFSDKILKTNLF
jgi:organic radical activating enzyme